MLDNPWTQYTKIDYCKHCGELIADQYFTSTQYFGWLNQECRQCWEEINQGKLVRPSGGRVTRGRVIRKPHLLS